MLFERRDPVATDEYLCSEPVACRRLLLVGGPGRTKAGTPGHRLRYSPNPADEEGERDAPRRARPLPLARRRLAGPGSRLCVFRRGLQVWCSADVLVCLLPFWGPALSPSQEPGALPPGGFGSKPLTFFSSRPWPCPPASRRASSSPSRSTPSQKSARRPSSARAAVGPQAPRDAIGPSSSGSGCLDERSGPVAGTSSASSDGTAAGDRGN